jgi:hypothetical protein
VLAQPIIPIEPCWLPLQRTAIAVLAAQLQVEATLLASLKERSRVG